MLKLCTCGCGGFTSICKYTDKRRGEIKGEPNRFIQGHNNKGKHRSFETKQKISKAHKGRKLSEEHKRKIGVSGKAENFLLKQEKR